MKKMVKFSDVKIEKNVRRALGDIHALADDIAKNGLRDVISVREDMTIVRGHRRFAAIKVIRAIAETSGQSPLPFEEVPVEVISVSTDEERIFLQLGDREGVRKNLTNWEQACAFYDLRKAGLTCREIGERVGLSEGLISKLAKAREVAIDEVRTLFDRGLDPPHAVLFTIARVHESQQMDEIQKWQEPNKRKARKKREGSAPEAGSENPSRGRILARTGPQYLKALLDDLKRAGPEMKSAVRVVRYLLGEINQRPVPKIKSFHRAIAA